MMKRFLILLLCIFTTDSFASGIATNAASAPCTNNTLETYSGNSNLAADWQPNTIQLRWYNENEKLTVQQSAQSCVYDGNLTIPATQPTRTGYTFAGWKVRMPGTYTELEYIESTGTQYINTGYNPNSNTKVEAKIQFFDTVNVEWPMVFGALSNGVRPHYSLYGSDSSRNRLFYTYGSSSTGGDNDIYVSYNTIGTPQFYTDYTLITEKNTLTVNGYSVTMGITPTFSIDNPLYLFAQNSQGGKALYKTPERMYYITIWDNGDLVRRMIPAKRNSDNVVGMWDAVTQTFYTNAGTGSFVAGPVVQ